MTGHMFEAAESTEAVGTVLALRDGICPPTIHLDTPVGVGPRTTLLTQRSRPILTLGISNSFGFGGAIDACVAFRKCE